MVLLELRGSLQALFVIGLALICWRKGAGPEKAVGSILALMVIIAWLYRKLVLPRLPGGIIGGYWDLDIVFLAVDGMSFAALMTVTFAANRRYPVFMAGFQLTALSTHFAHGLAERTTPLGYALLNILPFYFMIAALIVGLIRHVRRERRTGPYPSWRGSFARSLAQGRISQPSN